VTDFLRREAKFTMAWLILWPIVLIAVTVIVTILIGFRHS
jgi:hypothetical protein